MKNVMSILIIIMALTLTACGSNVKNTESTSVVETVETSNQAKEDRPSGSEVESTKK